jgi:hypothetical protein
LEKTAVKDDFRTLFRCMDFISKKANSDGGTDTTLYAETYQMLGVAWDKLTAKCKHWDGYTKKGFCKICGERKGKNEKERGIRVT